MTPQEPPFAIQLEPVEGCTLACSFCGIQSIRDNGANADAGRHGKHSPPYRFMFWGTVHRVATEAARLGWNPRWEFAMHGEPTLHKDLELMVRIIREHHPKGYIMVTSNGSGLLGTDGLSKIKVLFKAGLNTLALDMYNHAPFKDKLTDITLAAEEILDLVGPDDAGFDTVYRYPRDKAGNPHKRHARRMVTLVSDISDNSTGTHQLTNQGGNSFAVERLDQRCAKPFRELSVRWDGHVALCCDDWPGRYKVGNVNAMPLDELWNHPRFEAARRMLYHSLRDFGPCAGCNVRTHRNGLLPDKHGKLAMPRPDATTRKHIGDALAMQVVPNKVEGAPRRSVYTLKLTKGGR
jgi:radical SAM protein with 4Fe4S-binding SPASM domain